MNSKAFAILIVLILLFEVSLPAQTNKSKEVNELCIKAINIFTRDLDSAISLCDSAIKKSDDTLVIKSMLYKARIYFQVGLKNKSVDVFNQAVKIARNTNNIKGLYLIFFNWGEVEFYTGNIEKAQHFYLKANKYYEDIEDKSHPKILVCLGDIQLTIADTNKSKNYYQKALSISREWDRTTEMEVKERLARLYLTRGDIDSAYLYANEAKNYYDSLNITVVYNSPDKILAEIYLQNSRFDEAIEIWDNFRKYYIRVNDLRSKAVASSKLGKIYSKKDNLNKSLVFFEESYEINKKLKSHYLVNDCKNLSYTYEKLGKLGKALFFYKEYMNIYKEILSEKKLQQVNDMQVKYETEKKERENEKLSYELSISEKDTRLAQQSASRKNYLIIGVSILLILFIVIGLLLWNRRRVLYLYKMLRLEQNLLKTQMNPHFISNVLMSAQGFIFANKMEEASEYLTNVANLTRQVLENSRKEVVTLEEEIETIKSYLLVQQKRYKNFDFTVTIAEELDLEEIEVAPMLTQPIVENAIEHGINGVNYRGKVEINYSLTSHNKLLIFVRDNGRGISNPHPKEGQVHNSISSQIIKERLKNLADFYKQKLDFEITDSGIEGCTGTKVSLTLPLNLN